MANHNKRKQQNEANTRNRRQARENASDQVAIGFGFTSDWLSWWREFFVVKQNQSNYIQLLLSILN